MIVESKRTRSSGRYRHGRQAPATMPQPRSVSIGFPSTSHALVAAMHHLLGYHLWIVHEQYAGQAYITHAGPAFFTAVLLDGQQRAEPVVLTYDRLYAVHVYP